MQYNHKQIERKWQEIWEKEKPWNAEDFSNQEKFYCLVEFPYPSGDGLHVGHVRPYTALDIVARKYRMEGKNVMFPIGFDAFGLPTENYAIKHKVSPVIATEKNVANFTRQMKSLGLSFDWDRAINTTDPEYYKWTQWIFLQFYKHGLAYKTKMPINWCLSCKIGLANEEVVDGKCERCGGEVEKREKEQWMLRITEYAGRLDADLEGLDYAERIKLQQKNWIGKSEGVEINFRGMRCDLECKNPGNCEVECEEYDLPVYTTRVDTIFGVTAVVLAPEHSLVPKLTSPDYEEKVRKYIEQSKKKSEMERTSVESEKTGVAIGASAINPMTGEKVPVFIGDYVLAQYGTGAVMCVPAHDERDFDFAKKYGLDVRWVIAPTRETADFSKFNEAYTKEGFMVNSGEFSGLTSQDGRVKIADFIESKNFGKRQINYHLRDWVFSRQRYWGEPIPIVHCEECGAVPLLENELPLLLPEVKNYEPTDTGESPLAAMTGWVNTACPSCGGKAKRETDTMPNWAGSSWYFLRYIDPKNNKAFADEKKLKYWAPVDWYNGGMEHTTLHLLYSRFWYKFLYDIGAVPKECGNEPYKKRTSHGLILAKGGEKMSKSKGNVVNPDDVIKKFGADALRVYIMFVGPFEQHAEWDTSGLIGVSRFLEKVWNLKEKVVIQNFRFQISDFRMIKKLLHKTIKKVGDDIEEMKFNTAVSSLMILVNEMSKLENLPVEIYKNLIIMLAPFAPHLAEEIWEGLGNTTSVFKESWPEYDAALAKDENIEVVIQINGKVRDTITVPADITEEEIKTAALKSEKVIKFLKSVGVEDLQPKKVIFARGKLVNIVI
jgi:leucyl-tRNA synthetase